MCFLNFYLKFSKVISRSIQCKIDISYSIFNLKNVVHRTEPRYNSSDCPENQTLQKFEEPCRTLLLALVLVDLQNTCKKKLNRKMLERPNICYIFGKLGVQGCQIWHSHVSIPFNSAAAHSTRPHNAKKTLYVIISAEIPENLVHKSCCHKQ